MCSKQSYTHIANFSLYRYQHIMVTIVVEICFLDLLSSVFSLADIAKLALLLYIIDHSQYHNRCDPPAVNLGVFTREYTVGTHV